MSPANLLKLMPLPDEMAAPRGLRVEILDVEGAAAQIAEWRRLAAGCLEPNAFLEPEFALAAATHLAKRRPPQFIFVWDDRTLRGVCPLEQRSPFQARIWTHEQAPLGTPLLDRERAEETLAAIFAFCRQHLPKAPGLMFPALPQEGPTARLISALARAEGLSVHRLAAYRRPILSRADHDIERSFRSKRRKNFNRARRLLQTEGAVRFKIWSEPEELSRGAEQFLALEASGWKGRRGTAFLKSANRANFARSLLASISAERKLRIACLDCNGRPIAMAIVLLSNDRAFFWKITYDEAFAAFSPGVLLSLELSRSLLADRGIAVTDSCATADHPLLENLWRERLEIADLVVALRSDRKGFFLAIARERLRRGLRDRLKSIVRRFRRLRNSARLQHGPMREGSARTIDPGAQSFKSHRISAAQSR